MNILPIGSQDLYIFDDKIRFTIGKVLPAEGFKFSFSIRDRILREALKRGKQLEVTFSEFPEIKIINNPLQWEIMGKKYKKVGYFKDQPMTLFRYFVDFRGEISKKKQLQEQLSL